MLYEGCVVEVIECVGNGREVDFLFWRGRGDRRGVV